MSSTVSAAAVLLDIEGTLGPISYVRERLFPYAAQRLIAYVAAHRLQPGVAGVLAEAARLSGGDPLEALQDWQRRDVKAKPLKTLQGWIWAEGYAEGAFKSPLFADALAALRAWRATGLPLHVYSSGSRTAQELYFRHSEAGDLRGLFADFHDTRVGPKTEPASYLTIARAIGIAPEAILFLSDNPDELAAAAEAGLQVGQVVKDGLAPDPRFASVADFGTLQVTPTERVAAG